jgi:hypothetical protein
MLLMKTNVSKPTTKWKTHNLTSMLKISNFSLEMIFSGLTATEPNTMERVKFSASIFQDGFIRPQYIPYTPLCCHSSDGRKHMFPNLESVPHYTIILLSHGQTFPSALCSRAISDHIRNSTHITTSRIRFLAEASSLQPSDCPTQPFSRYKASGAWSSSHTSI